MSWYDEPEGFTTGTVGVPGQRVFYLQSHGDGAVRSVRLEKQQVMALADYLQGLLADLPAPDGVAPAPALVEPVDADWSVGNIGVAYDHEHDRIVIVAEEFVDDDERDGDSLRVAISRSQVRAFIDRAAELVAGGRPPCPLCAAPLDPSGHACPRAN